MITYFALDGLDSCVRAWAKAKTQARAAQKQKQKMRNAAVTGGLVPNLAQIVESMKRMETPAVTE